jgi:hypothetical protein
MKSRERQKNRKTPEKEESCFVNIFLFDCLDYGLNKNKYLLSNGAFEEIKHMGVKATLRKVHQHC